MGSYGPPPKKFLQFRKLLRPSHRKTDRWEVLSHDGCHLGYARFYPQWRCYITEDATDIAWSGSCHAEATKFLNEQTELWRKSIRARKKKKGT